MPMRSITRRERVLSGTVMAAGLKPGWSPRFAFEQLASFDAAAWQKPRADERAEDVQ